MSLALIADADLVARCRGGEQAAWDELVNRFSRYVYAITSRVYRLSQQDAEDVPGRLRAHLRASRRSARRRRGAALDRDAHPPAVRRPPAQRRAGAARRGAASGDRE